MGTRLGYHRKHSPDIGVANGKIWDSPRPLVWKSYPETKAISEPNNKKRAFETRWKCCQDSETGLKFSETHAFLSTIRHPSDIWTKVWTDSWSLATEGQQFLLRGKSWGFSAEENMTGGPPLEEIICSMHSIVGPSGWPEVHPPGASLNDRWSAHILLTSRGDTVHAVTAADDNITSQQILLSNCPMKKYFRNS